MLLLIYRNISIALTQFIDYINADPEILSHMSNIDYKEYHYGISKILHHHEFCILINDLNRFVDVISNNGVLSDFNETLYFNFESNLKVGYVWTESESDQWETEKDEEENVDDDNDDFDNSMRNVFDNGDPQPVKKVKGD